MTPVVSRAQEVPSLTAYGRDFIPDLIGSTGRIFSYDNLPLALVGFGLAGLTANVDHVDRNIKNYFQTRRPMDDLFLRRLHRRRLLPCRGRSGALGSRRTLGQQATGQHGHRDPASPAFERNSDRRPEVRDHRLRPNGGDHMSFPSGHASSTATLAASISAMYDWDLEISIPLYATAVFVGASRIQDNMHYLSDVMAGIALGTIVGSGVANYHKGKERAVVLKNISFSRFWTKILKAALLP